MASKEKNLRRYGPFFSGAVVLAFFLPFFNITCAGMEIVHWSGFDMVHGGKPGGKIIDMAKGMKKEFGDKNASKKDKAKKKKDDVGSVPVRVLAIVAFLGAILMFTSTLIKRRQTVIACTALGAFGFATLIGLYFQVKADTMGDTRLGPKKEKKAKKPALPETKITVKEKQPKVEFGTSIGYWLACIGFIAVGIFGGLALREPEAIAAAGTSPSPPPPGPAPPV